MHNTSGDDEVASYPWFNPNLEFKSVPFLEIKETAALHAS